MVFKLWYVVCLRVLIQVMKMDFEIYNYGCYVLFVWIVVCGFGLYYIVVFQVVLFIVVEFCVQI